MLIEPGLRGVAVVVGWLFMVAGLAAVGWWAARRLGEEPGASRRPSVARTLALLGCTVTLVGLGMGLAEALLVVALGQASATSVLAVAAGAALAGVLLVLARRHGTAVLVGAGLGILVTALLGMVLAATSTTFEQWQSGYRVLWVGSLLPAVVAVLGVRRPLPAGLVLLGAAGLGWLTSTLAAGLLAWPVPVLHQVGWLLLTPTLWGGLLLVLSATLARRHTRPAVPSRDGAGTARRARARPASAARAAAVGPDR
jgi:hypothetical protein